MTGGALGHRPHRRLELELEGPAIHGRGPIAKEAFELLPLLLMRRELDQLVDAEGLSINAPIHCRLLTGLQGTATCRHVLSFIISGHIKHSTPLCSSRAPPPWTRKDLSSRTPSAQCIGGEIAPGSVAFMLQLSPSC